MCFTGLASSCTLPYCLTVILALPHMQPDRPEGGAPFGLPLFKASLGALGLLFREPHPLGEGQFFLRQLGRFPLWSGGHAAGRAAVNVGLGLDPRARSEEHTSELQSQSNL